MKRRIMAILVVALLIFTFAACGNGDSAAPPADSGSSAATPPADSGSSGGSSAAAGEVDKSDWIAMDLTFATYLPETEAGMYDQMIFRNKLEEYMPGLITWTDYWAGTLLTEEAMYEGIVAGTADYGYVTPMAGDFPLSLIWTQAAMGVQSAAGSTAAFLDWVQNEKPAEYEDVVFLWSFANGPSGFMAHNPIRSVADLNGLQLYCATGMTESINALGAVGVNMANGEVYEAVRSGLVDGVYSTIGSQARNGLVPELLSDICQVPMGTQVGGYCMNKDKFNSMPPSQQEAFIAAFNDAFYNTYVPEVENIRILTDTIILPAAEETAFTVFSPGTPEYQEFYDLVYPVTEAYLESLNDRGIDGKAEFETIKRYLDKWETNWFTFDRYMEPFIAASEGTFQASDYTVPEGMPGPGKA